MLFRREFFRYWNEVIGEMRRPIRVCVGRRDRTICLWIQKSFFVAYPDARLPSTEPNETKFHEHCHATGNTCPAAPTSCRRNATRNCGSHADRESRRLISYAPPSKLRFFFFLFRVISRCDASIPRHHSHHHSVPKKSGAEGSIRALMEYVICERVRISREIFFAAQEARKRGGTQIFSPNNDPKTRFMKIDRQSRLDVWIRVICFHFCLL